MNLKTADLKNKRVILRAEFNVPTDKQGNISEDTRIIKTLPTIKYILENGAKQLIIITHFGRPKGKFDEKYKVDKIAKRLEELLGEKVVKIDEVCPNEVNENTKIVMLENLRFTTEEESNDENFAKSLAKLADIYVNDAFGVCHRSHASVDAITKFLPSFAGLLLQKEIDTLNEILKSHDKPLTLIVGGAKIDTKIGVLKNFVNKADFVLVGGGIANTFLFSEGFDIGNSLCEKDKLSTAQEIMLDFEAHDEKFNLPTDVITASEIKEDAETLDLPVEDVEGDMRILDIGKETIFKYLHIINKSKMIIWNGPLGLFEYKPFEKGTKLIAEALSVAKGKVIIGGGETIEALKKFGISEDRFYHVSTGGGAMLEYLEGKELPGIKALQQK